MAGESARREYERRRQARGQAIRESSDRLALYAALTIGGGAVGTALFVDSPWPGLLLGSLHVAQKLAPDRKEAAWRKGAEGEERTGRLLDEIGPACRTLHDRRMPMSRANIDHILVAPTGVWTVDSKNYSGKLEVRNGNTELWVHNRNRSTLLTQARSQRDAVSGALACAGLGHVPVQAALCFHGVDWPLIRPTHVGDVRLTAGRGLARLAKGEPVIPVTMISRVATVLERALPRVLPHEAGPGTATPPAPTGRSRQAHVGYPPPSTADLSVRPWKRYGKSRLYVNRRDGSTVGFIDLHTNEVSARDDRDRRIVREAVAAYLRS